MREVMVAFGRSRFGQRFYLAGGTALALQLGHRLSIDLDFFSPTEDISTITSLLLDSLHSFAPMIADTAWGNLVLVANDVKVGFYGYSYNMLALLVDADGVQMASVIDIGLMKMDALLARASRKDFHDLYAICQRIPLQNLLEQAPRKFPGLRDFEALVVTFDQDSCLLYKERLASHLGLDTVDVVISVSGNDSRYRPYKRDRDAEEKLLDRFRDPNDPLQIIVVTAKLLTGFDAPILQAMYLDKPMRDHTLLQAITRVNRTYGDKKTHGLIVDYLGVFDNVAKSLEFDEEGFRRVISDIANLKAKLPEATPALRPQRGAVCKNAWPTSPASTNR